MREIKFRAWDSKNNLLTDVLMLAWFQKPMPELGTAQVVQWEKQKYASDFKNLVFMQYTGLTDRNGKEIYEGDILAPWHGFNRNGRVVIESLGVGVRTADGTWNGQIGHRLFECEIIGNIYENRGLLNGER